MKRVIWIWLAEGATEIERTYWERFVKVNMTVSDSVRFLVASTNRDLTVKGAALERAGWRCERQGDGLMERIKYYVKEDGKS